MFDVDIGDEPIDSSGARSCFYAAVDELHRRYGDMDNSPDLAPEELNGPLGVFLVARFEGHPVGGVGLRPIGVPTSRFAEVKRLWVRADKRRDGIATALMSALETWGRDAGYRRLFLETGAKQPEAISFYRREGWHRVEHFPPGAESYPSAHRFAKDL